MSCKSSTEVENQCSACITGGNSLSYINSFENLTFENLTLFPGPGAHAENCTDLYLIGTKLHLIGTYLCLIGTKLYLIGTKLYAIGTDL